MKRDGRRSQECVRISIRIKSNTYCEIPARKRGRETICQRSLLSRLSCLSFPSRLCRDSAKLGPSMCLYPWNGFVTIFERETAMTTTGQMTRQTSPLLGGVITHTQLGDFIISSSERKEGHQDTIMPRMSSYSVLISPPITNCPWSWSS